MTSRSSAISTEVSGTTPRTRQDWRVASPLCKYPVLLRPNGVLRAAGGLDRWCESG